MTITTYTDLGLRLQAEVDALKADNENLRAYEQSLAQYVESSLIGMLRPDTQRYLLRSSTTATHTQPLAEPSSEPLLKSGRG